MSVKPSVDKEDSVTKGGEEKPFVGPEDLGGFDPGKSLGEPGQFPYTLRPHRTMYRQRLWSMRPFVGFGSAVRTYQRLK